MSAITRKAFEEREAQLQQEAACWKNLALLAGDHDTRALTEIRAKAAIEGIRTALRATEWARKALDGAPEFEGHQRTLAVVWSQLDALWVVLTTMVSSVRDEEGSR
jgi:hypothetical protein